MEQDQLLAVSGWIRENFNQSFLDDLIQIVLAFYCLKLESSILSQDEKESLLNLLFDVLKKQEMHKNIRSMDTKLLFKASQHQFDNKKFHQFCDYKGPTITIIHNEHDHVFGGYLNKSREAEAESIADPNAFLFSVRPKIKHIALKESHKDGEKVIINHGDYGPTFGRGDIWISDKCDQSLWSFALQSSFEFEWQEIVGSDTDCWFKVKEYEVFSVCVE